MLHFAGETDLEGEAEDGLECVLEVVLRLLVELGLDPDGVYAFRVLIALLEAHVVDVRVNDLDQLLECESNLFERDPVLFGDIRHNDDICHDNSFL